MRIPINKLLIGAFLSYISWEIFTLYQFCQPRVLAEGDRSAVRWDLLQEGALDLGVFLADTAKPPLVPLSAKQQAAFIKLRVLEKVSPKALAELGDVKVLNLSLPARFYKNGTLYLHVLATRPASTLTLRYELTKISRHVLQPDRRVPTRFLLNETEADMRAPGKPITSLPRAIEVGFVEDDRPLDKAALAEKGLGQLVQGAAVKLPMYVNTLISPRDEYVPLEPGKQSPLPPFELRFRNIGLAFWSMQQQAGKAFDDAEKLYGMNEFDVDSFKQMIGGSSPYKILVVYGITILHLIFEYLAFSSDISFWRQKTSFEGMSSSSVALAACTNVIMFFYVQEQRQTKFVLYFLGFRFLLNLWKLRRLTTFRRCAGFPYVAWVNRAGVSAGFEELEDVNDAETRCMRWLMVVLLPVIGAIGVYRLVHYRFRSWYSWAVMTLAICAQTGGFVIMTPQVFMNYRLKSVEHLPWKALTYQAINTFIDDIFMLSIRMPEVQKYSVFRDDIVFVICCIQRWLYRKKRVEPEQSAAEASERHVENELTGSAEKDKDKTL